MESSSPKRKMYNWRMLLFVIVAIGIFIKFFVLEKKEAEKEPTVVELDLESIGARKPEEVEALLGPGKTLSFVKDVQLLCDSCPRNTYKEGRVEILFVKDAADLITLRGLSEFDFDGTTILHILGFKDIQPPTIADQNMIRWDNYQRFSHITAFSKNGKLDYVVVRVKQR